MSLKEVFSDVELSIELRRLVKAIPTTKKAEAIKLLRTLVSNEAYEEEKRRDEAIAEMMFGQVTCGSCGTRHNRNSNCWHCYINSP